MRIARDEAATRPNAAVHVAGPFLRRIQLEQRTDVRVRELAAPLIEPVLELRGVIEVKAVEQRAHVHLRDAREVARRNRLAQVDNVASDHGGIEHERIARRSDRAVAECRAQYVDGEVEETTRVRGVALGPEQRHRPLAGDGLRPRGRDEREQRDAVALRRRAAQGRVRGAQARAAE